MRWFLVDHYPPGANLDRRRQDSAMQIPATTHGTVYQAGFISGARIRKPKDLQGSRHDVNLVLSVFVA